MDDQWNEEEKQALQRKLEQVNVELVHARRERDALLRKMAVGRPPKSLTRSLAKAEEKLRHAQDRQTELKHTIAEGPGEEQPPVDDSEE